MTTKSKSAARSRDRRPRPEAEPRSGARRTTETPQPRRVRRQPGTAPAPSRESRPRTGPQHTGSLRIGSLTKPAKSTGQAKARAKARKAKAPKVVRVPLRERVIARLASVDLRPRTLAAKIPFVVLIIGSLGIGLGITLWLSTDAAERSYQLGNLRERNRVLLQQKEALERDVLTAQAAPALAEAARNLGMIPTKDTAHLVQDPAGNWVVVGVPKPAEGVPPPPLNTKLPEDRPVPPPASAPPAARAEVPVRLGADPAAPATPGLSRSGPEVLVRTPDGGMTLGTQHLTDLGPAAPGPNGLPSAVPPPAALTPAGPPPGPVGLPVDPAFLPAGAVPPAVAAPPVEPGAAR